MIDPITAAKLVKSAYDPAFVAGGVVPDLAPLGCTNVLSVWGADAALAYPYGFLATMLDGSQVLALRGTDSGIEWVEDAQIRMVTNPWGPGLVHSGFLAICRTLGIGEYRQPLLPSVTSLASLAVVGHSLGAAVSRLLSMQLGHVGSVQTWGEPRSCNGDAAGYALSCTSANRRARNPRDLVPMVPMFDPMRPIDGYRHAGEPLLLPAFGTNPVEAHAMDTYIQLETSVHASI